ncbi:MAG: AMP-binding protein, partial [Spirochaetaceae bacterium]|nr:AMP-binding protein [Spirochaetaceae bacterium]
MTVAELGLRAAEKYRRRKAFEIYGDGHLYTVVSFEEFGLRIRQFAALLYSLGLKPGDRAMILSENRPEWAMAYFGTALAGVAAVPVLTEFPAEHLAAIAAHAEVSALWTSGKFAEKLGAAGFDPDIPVIYLDTLRGEEGAGEAKKTGAPVFVGGNIRVSIRGTVKDLALRKMDPRNLRAPVFPESGEDDLASIIYTSGTTGNSKGVMLSNRSLTFTVLAARSLLKIFPRDRLFSIIPLAHTYECTLGLLMAVFSGASTTYLDKAPSPAVLLPAIQALRPTAMHTVPLIIEKIYRGRLLPALKANPLYRFPLTRPLALRLAGQKLLSFFGGAVRFFGIGGAALSEDTEQFLRQAQFPYAPGYGLTEAAPLVAGTAPYKTPAGAAGRVLKGVEVRIVDKGGQVVGGIPLRSPYRPFAEGEIQVRGPNIMLGYYKNEQLTREAFTADGWLKTGDLGCFDRKGFLYIRGRLKTMILGPSGENVYPEEIERLLTSSGMAEDALVYPGERGELVALIVLSEKAKTMLAAIGDGLGELKNTVNQKLASFSRISRIEIQNEPFEKTPTQKIKRFLYVPGEKAS